MSKREFELDLTSVCVGSGVVQLPLKMQSLFIAGDLPAIVDGEALLLAFSEPRRLSGFKEHFERRGLRSNDKVRFEVDIADDRVVALVAASIKRERTKPTQQRTSPEHGASDEAHAGSVAQQPASSQVSSSWGDLDGGGQVRAVRKVRVEGGLPQPISPATQQFTASARSDVHRHRDARSASRGAAGFGGWTPLDGLSPEGDQQLPSLHDYPDATVREVRRSRASSNAAEVARTVDLEVAWASAAAEQSLPPLYSHGFEVTDQYSHTAQRSAEPAAVPTASIPQVPTSRRSNETMRPVPEAVEQLAAVPSRQLAEVQVSRAVPRSTGETTAAQPHLNSAVAAPRIPVPRNTAAGSTWQPTPASGLNSPEASEGVRQPRLIEEVDITPVRVRADGATPATRPVQYGQGMQHGQLGQRSQELQHGQPGQRSQELQHGQPMRDGALPQPSLDHGSPTLRAQAPARNPVAHAIDDAEFGGEYLPSGRSLEAALLESSNGQAGRAARAASSVTTDVTTDVATSQPAPQQMAPADRMAADPEPTRPEPIGEQLQSEPVRLEDDLRKVEAYLDRPNTPAIVRSEVVAAELGIDDQRSERALERLSENRDRVSRIRKGAYMVKSSATGHSSRF